MAASTLCGRFRGTFEAELEVVDIHAHVWADPPCNPNTLLTQSGLDGSVHSLLAAMDAAGISQTCLVTPTAMAGDERETESAVALYPDRFFGMACGYRREGPDAAWSTGPTDCPHVRLSIRGLGSFSAGSKDLDQLLSFADSVPGVLAVHADADQIPVIRKISSARSGRWTLLDHFGRPEAGSPVASGFQSVLDLVGLDQVALKTPNLSYFSRVGFPFRDLQPLIDVAFDAFGVHRILWGSDWPLCTHESSFRANLDAIQWLLEGRTWDEKNAIFSQNARRIFAR